MSMAAPLASRLGSTLKANTLSTGSPLWTPARLGTSLVTMFDASALASISQVGGSISAMTNLGSGGGGIFQATGSVQPSYAAAGRNGRPAILFNGAQKLQRSDATILPSGNSDRLCACVMYSAGNTQRYAWGYGSGSPPDAGFSIAVSSDQKVIADYTANSAVGATAISGDNIVLIQNINNTQSVYINGSLYLTSNRPLVTPSSAPFALGCWPAFGGLWLGAIQEFDAVSGAITTSIRQRIEGYLAWKWGIVEKLPVNHPYKSAAPRV